MHNSYKMLELFPTPIYTTLLPTELSQVIPWFLQQDMLDEGIDSMNYGNRSKNSYILNEPQCTDLKSFILNNVKEYGKQLGYDYQEYRFGQSWLSFKYPNQHHTMHTHPNSLISGVFYFGENSQYTPAIKFHKIIAGINAPFISPKTISDRRSLKYAHTEFSINFTPGLLLLFPSHLPHSVPLNKSNAVRCSLAFNVVPVWGFGDEIELTELKF